MFLPIGHCCLFHISMMSAYLENEREFSANISDYLVIMLNLHAYRENEWGKDERGQGRKEGGKKKEKGRGGRERI